MKKLLFFLILLLFASNQAHAGSWSCSAKNARVISIMPWGDGATFINLDIANDCGCSIPTRFGFYPTNQHAKTFLAQALTAFVNKSPVSLYGESGCTVHNNTASLYTIVLGE